MIEAIVGSALHAIVAGTIASAVLCGIVFLIVRTLALSASTRHALWTIALITSAMLPIAGLAVSAVRAIGVPVALSYTPAYTRAVAERGVRIDPAPAPKSEAVIAPDQRAAFRNLAWQPHLSRSIALGIVAVWLVGVLIGVAGLFSSLIRVRGLKVRSSPLDGSLADELPWITDPSRGGREIYLRLSYETETPVAIGFQRPVILIPTELATAGGLEAIEQLVMHEYAHLRRYDDWTNLAQRLIERLFWFNPLVWIVGRRIALEREIASDDAVVARTGRAKEYANSLWRLAREMRMPENAVVAPGALLTRKQITVRIESLLAARPSIPSLTPLSALGVIAAAACCIVAVGTSAPALEVPVPTVQLSAISTATPHPVVQRPVHKATTVATVAVVTPAPAPAPTHPIVPAKRTLHKQDATVASAAHTTKDIGATIADQVNATVNATVSAVLDSTLDSPAPAQANASTLATFLRHCIGCNLSGRDLHGADLRGIKLVGADLTHADLHNADLRRARLTGVDLRGANLEGADLRDAAFMGTTIDGASLRGADTRGLKLVGASLAHLDLRGLEVRDLLSNCTGCDLAGANLRGLDLRNVNLIGANLHDVDLTGADLRLANFTGAALDGANFTNADLRGATFNGVSLSRTIMTGANIDGATFTGSDLRGLHQ